MSGFTFKGQAGELRAVEDSQGNLVFTISDAGVVDITNADSLTTAGVKAPTEIVIEATLDAASVDKHVLIANRAYEITSVREIHSVVGGSGADVRPRKILAASASAPGASAGANVKELTTAVLDLTSTADTQVSGTLAATAADLQFAAGDKLSLLFSGTLTGLVGRLVITLKAI